MEMSVKKTLTIFVLGLLMIVIIFLIYLKKSAVDPELKKICIEIQKRENILDPHASIENGKVKEYLEWLQAGDSHIFWKKMEQNKVNEKGPSLTEECAKMGITIKR